MTTSFSEWWGTFLLVVVAAGAHVVAAQSNGKMTLDMIVVAPGLMVMAIIYFMGTVSGAHLNPAVTLTLRSATKFSLVARPRLHHCAVGWRHRGGAISPHDVWEGGQSWRYRKQLRGEILRLHSDLGFTLVYVTHRDDEAAQIGNRTIHIRQGRIDGAFR